MKKRLLLLLAIMGMSSAMLWAQDDLVSSAEEIKLLYGKVYKAYVEDPENVSCLVDLSRFYAMDDNPMRNLCLALKYADKAESLYVSMVDDKSKYKEVSRLIKKKITVVSVREYKQEVVEAMRKYLKADRLFNEEELSDISEAYSAYPDVLLQVEHHKLNRIFQKAKEENSLEALYAFISKYPGTYEAEECELAMGKLAAKQFANLDTESAVDGLARPYLSVASVAREATQRKGQIAYATARAINTSESYRLFLSKYPSSAEYLDALDMMDSLLVEEYSHLTSSIDIANFAQANPGTELAGKAMDQLRRRILENQDIPTLKIYLKMFPLDSSYWNIYSTYYGWVSAEGNRNPIERFAAENPDFPFKAAVEDDLYQASRIDSINLLRSFEESDFRANATKVYKLTGKDVSFVGLQRSIQKLVAAKEWDAVLERMDFFDLCFEDWATDKYNDLIKLVKAPIDKRKSITVGCAPSYDMIHPQIAPDGRLYYTRKEGSQFSIYVADKDDNGVWRSAGPLTFTNATNQSMWFYGIYDGGNKMMVGQQGDVHLAVKDGKKWTLVPILDTNVNSKYYEADAFLLPDGSGMLLCSDRPGGHNFQASGAYFHGDTAKATDLYYIPLDGDKWGEAVNLGIGVNTSCCERSPILSKDMKTLYFVSDGHVGFGYGDIFTAQRTDIDDWCHWTSVKNYGKETNTGYDESSLSFSADGKTLFYSTNQRGRAAFYMVAATHEEHGGFCMVDVSAEGSSADIYLYDIATRREVGRYENASSETKKFSLYSDKMYMVQVRNSENYIPSQVFCPKKTTTIVVSADNQKDTIDLPSVQFESNKIALTELSKQEIMHLAEWLKAHHEVKAEIQVHVAGSDSQQSYRLSRQRGDLIAKVLEERGLSRDSFVVSCYGNIRVHGNSTLPQVQLILVRE